MPEDDGKYHQAPHHTNSHREKNHLTDTFSLLKTTLVLFHVIFVVWPSRFSFSKRSVVTASWSHSMSEVGGSAGGWRIRRRGWILDHGRARIVNISRAACVKGAGARLARPLHIEFQTLFIYALLTLAAKRKRRVTAIVWWFLSVCPSVRPSIYYIFPSI